MIIQGIDFNVSYWKGKTEKQFLKELEHAYPKHDLKAIHKELMQSLGVKTESVKVIENIEGAE